MDSERTSEGEGVQTLRGWAEEMYRALFADFPELLSQPGEAAALAERLEALAARLREVATGGEQPRKG